MTSTIAHQNQLKAIRRQTSTHLTELWDGLPDYNKPQAEPFAKRAVQVVTAAQLLAARTTAAYLGRKIIKPPPRIRPAQVTDLRNGTTPIDTYQRPFGKVWHALGQGKPLDEAITLGRKYLPVLASMDIGLAMKAAAALVGETDQRITGWVRMADATACDLCSAADGERLSSPSDMGLHPGCGCTVEPSDDATSSAADPSVFAVHDSDEVGPLLYAAGHNFAA